MKIKYFNNVSFIMKGLLGYLAYFSVYPPCLAPFMHKLCGVKITHPTKVYIAPAVLIDSLYPEMLTIEDQVYLTRGVAILCHTNYTPALQVLLGSENVIRPVHIGYGTFIGVNAIILPGVTIGKYSIIAAGSVVTKNVPAYTIFGGNPARQIGVVPQHD